MLTVSILTPVYGVEKYIEQCARSLFGQSYAQIEYIFVDDCTPTAVSPFWNLLSKNIQKGLRRYASSIMRKIGAGSGKTKRTHGCTRRLHHVCR